MFSLFIENSVANKCNNRNTRNNKTRYKTSSLKLKFYCMFALCNVNTNNTSVTNINLINSLTVYKYMPTIYIRN